MSDNSEAKIKRWEGYIEECRREAKLLSAEGQRTMQTVIDSYERLIVMVRDQDRKIDKAGGPTASGEPAS